MNHEQCDECSEVNRPGRWDCAWCGGLFRKCGCPFGKPHECTE